MKTGLRGEPLSLAEHDRAAINLDLWLLEGNRRYEDTLFQPRPRRIELHIQTSRKNLLASLRYYPLYIHLSINRLSRNLCTLILRQKRCASN
jgi:hypothetical protein